jgi:alpha-N-arabinofuranosidase
MRRYRLALAVLMVPLFAAVTWGQVRVSIDPGRVVGRIDEKIYGQFLEHIYHSCNGGLWGEMVWDRSFEETPLIGGGTWRIEDDALVQTSRAANVRFPFGDPAWKDYQFTLEAQKTGGNEGFLILFRVTSDEEFYWCNFGGARNDRFYLERGLKDGQRWRTVGKPVEGAIETGKWYPIRVRCQGRRFQVWLDGKQVLDFTDDDKAHLAGKVGVGTWLTQARFRNLKVASLDGKPLFAGLPEMPAQAGTARWWEAYGPGKVSLSMENPLNSDCCQRVVSEAGGTGLQQKPFYIRRGETYRGSVWVRGRAPDGLVVRVLDDTARVAELPLRAPTSEWGEFLFQFKAEATVAGAILQVGVRGKGTVWIDQVSLMADSSRATGGYRPDLLKAIADLRPPVIRWPGGSFASNYRWKDGIGPQHKRRVYPRAMWDDQDVNSYGTDEFVAMCRKIGAEPLIVIDIGMGEPPDKRADYCREACDWVEYCNGPAASKWGGVRAANGHPEPYGVKFWEIDNEVWRLKPDDYASVVRQFVPAMKKVAPSILVAACGSGQLGRAWGDGDAAVINQCADLVNYLSIHHYESPTRFAEGPAAAETFWQTLSQRVAKSRNPNLKFYVSEWNAQSTDWRTGLYAGGLLNAFERCGDVIGMAGPALFLRHVSATRWDNAFINFDNRTWFPAPNYVVMKLWRDHYAPQRVEMAGDLGGVSAVATRSADGKKVYFKAVNPADVPAEVRLEVKGDFAPARASLAQVAPDSLQARNTLDQPRAVAPVAGNVLRDGRAVCFTLPRWSAAVLTLEK